MNRPNHPALALGLVALLVGACSPGAAATPTAGLASLGPRPSSPATVAIVAPTSGARVTGTSVHVVLSLTGATIVPATTTAITPTTGHVHLYVDNQLVSMNYGLEQDLPITAGSHVLKAEFVAADHAPFSPRVYSDQVIFTVQ
ncbi:MAG: hypothetical protein QOI92_339 [Chloroflexota bacterium]|jgi:hypothetical protein|nr:hypothetical protein [Chloroflexota bacterium]